MSRARLRAALFGAVMLVAGTTGAAPGAASAADQSTVAPAARFALALNAPPCSNRTTGYGVGSDGNLWLYVFGGQEGNCATSWTSRTVIDSGWSGVQQVFADHNTIFAIGSNGDMKWYGYDPVNHSWQPGSGLVIGGGWDGFTHVAYAGDGVFYAVDGDGTLFWYRRLDVTQEFSAWYNDGVGAAIGSGFQIADQFFAARGAVYLSDSAGNLFWYGYSDSLSPDGVWVPTSGARIGAGWNTFTSVSAEWGVAISGSPYVYIAGADANGDLLVYQHYGPDTGVANWGVIGAGTLVGGGTLN